MLTNILGVSLLGSVLCLDRIFIQAMFSRPVVAAPLIGLFLGDVYVGLIMGAFMELIWIDRLPIGTYVPPNDSVAAVAATSMALLTRQKAGISEEGAWMSLCVLAAIPCGLLAKYLDVMIIRSNDALSDRALTKAKTSDVRAIERTCYWGLMKTFATYFVFLFVVQWAAISLLNGIAPRLNETMGRALAFLYYFFPLLGIAVAMNMLKIRRTVPLVCAMFLVLSLLLEIFHVR